MASVLEQLIPLADAHREADQYRARYYWRGNGDGTGCAVGCSIHDAVKLGILPDGTDHGDHQAVSRATGMPEMLWRLADHIFEGLDSDSRPAWTPRFLRSASKCTNFEHVPSRIMARFAERLAEDAIRDDVKQVCQKVAALWRRRAAGEDPPDSEWGAAWHQAKVAWHQADDAREQAKVAWHQAKAAWHQADAAWHQADAAREQAYAARWNFWSWCADVVCDELLKP